MNIVFIYRCSFFLALVRPPEDVERTGVCVALIDINHPQVNI